MVLIKHNYLKPDIFFNPIFIPGFSEPTFLGSGSRVRVRVQGLGQGPGFGFRVRVQVIEIAEFHDFSVIVIIWSKDWSFQNIVPVL